MFSQTQEYALRAVIWLASHREEGAVGNLRIAEETDTPPTYLSKVLQGLAKQGIVTSRRGAGGGFQLAHDPAALTVLEVINAVDPLKRIHTCPLKLRTHGKNLCSMHARLDSALAMVEEALGNSTIKDMMSSPGRPTPMVETPRRRNKK